MVLKRAKIGKNERGKENPKRGEKWSAHGRVAKPTAVMAYEGLLGKVWELRPIYDA